MDHRNAHRKNKKSFSIMLTADEQALVNAAKRRLCVTQNKQLLMKLIRKVINSESKQTAKNSKSVP
jgi:hypothetical protein